MLLDPETVSRSPYKLITNETHITIEVPVGAEGGYIQVGFCHKGGFFAKPRWCTNLNICG